MMDQTIRIGLIGCGSITHFIHIPGLQLSPNTVLAAACDASEAAARATAQQCNIPKVSSDYQDIVEDPDIDAVVIATPNNLHKPVSLAALAAGKHVLCEKPLGLNSGECDDLVEAAKKSDKVKMVSFVYRFTPAMRYMKHLVDSGALGEIRHFRAFYLQQVPEVWLGWRSNRSQAGSGGLGDIGTHLIDFALYLLGDISSVSGWAKQYLPKRQVGTSGKFADVDVDDAAGFLTEFDCGASGVFEATRMVPGRGCGQNEYQSVEINGSKGSLVYYLQDPFHLQQCLGEQTKAMDLLTTVPVPEEFLKWYDTPRSVTAYEPNLGFRYDQAYAFTQAIHGIRREPLANFEDGRRSQVVVDAVLEAAQCRRWVDIKK